jgi:predicted nucleic acid-binding protein
MVQAFVDGEVAIEPLKRKDLKRVMVLMAKYQELGLVDCSLVAMAEHLQLDTIATTDRRHFAMVRPTHVKRFTLVP